MRIPTTGMVCLLLALAAPAQETRPGAKGPKAATEAKDGGGEVPHAGDSRNELPTRLVLRNVPAPPSACT